jgi:hypothetical protein
MSQIVPVVEPAEQILDKLLSLNSVGSLYQTTCGDAVQVEFERSYFSWQQGIRPLS